MGEHSESQGSKGGRGFLLWPWEEFLQAAEGQRLSWNPGV